MFETSDHVKKPLRLEKYAKLYHLFPMGEKDGLWFYHSHDSINESDYEKNAYSHTKIPTGHYAVVTKANPFIFSWNRVWNCMCDYIQNNKESINGITLSDTENTACFTRFYKKYSTEYMAVYVPVK